MSVRLSVPQISLNAFLVPVSNSPILTRPELSTIPTNPPPQHLQIPSISPILPLLTFPHQHPNRPPYPVPRASLLPHADLSVTAFPPTMLAGSSSSTLPFHLHPPPLNRPTRRREIVQTFCGRGGRREVRHCVRQVEEGCLEAVLLRGLRWWRGLGCDSCPGGFAAVGAGERY